MDVVTSADDQAIMLLCSLLGMPVGGGASDIALYSPAEWNLLARRLATAGLRPGDLLDLDSAKLAEQIRTSLGEGERIKRLLERGGLLAIELERLANLGIRALTRASGRYPAQLRTKLREAAPPVLFYSGELRLAEARSLAVVGSRNVEEVGTSFAERATKWAVRAGVTVVSGAARGVDAVAMRSALESDGTVVGFPADSLERLIRSVDARRAIAEERLLLVTPFHPRAPFSIGNAMGRNKLIYAQATWALVVAAEVEKGGSWAGAVECLRAGWTPVFARSGEAAPAGNTELLRLGALPFPMDFDEEQTIDEILQAVGVGKGKQAERQSSPLDIAEPPPSGEEVPADGSEEGYSDSSSEAPKPSSEGSDTPRWQQASDSVWPEGWECFIEEARGEDELAQRFGLPRTTIRVWMKELIESGRVRKTTRPVRYQLVPMSL